MAKIFIAEDDDNLRAMLAHMVGKMGHVPLLPRNGRRAAEIVEDDKDIALILTDMAMPEMNGRELIAHVRSLPGYASKPILVFSGVVGPKDIADILDLGATAFLPKPPQFAESREYLTRHLASQIPK